MASASCLIRDPVRPPQDLPTTIEQSEGWAREPAAPTVAGSEPLSLFLTIDTEDAYFERPHMITGEGIGRDYGVYGILDELEARSMRATFFVNVYESERQPPGVIEGVVREIAERGHEIGLHTHPSPSLDFYQRPLFRLKPQHQADILRWGVERLERWAGCRIASFRAGGYALNQDTFTALAEVGIAIDSSWFFPSANNHMARSTVNAVTEHGSLVEVPVTTVLREAREGELEHRKLDLDWLSTEHLRAALGAVVGAGAGFAMFMMHSFSFIEKQTRMPDDQRSPKALFASEPLFNRYVEIYGPKPSMREAFREFLDAVAATPAVRVRTLRDAQPQLVRAAHETRPDVIPIVSG